MPGRLPRAHWRSTIVDSASGSGRVQWLEAGTGDPLVFLHGWGLSPRAYRAALVRLCAAGVRVVAPALPGFGGSARMSLSELDLDHFAERTAAFIDQLELDRPAFVVGHSLGGGVAIKLAHQRPDLVRALTLVNSVGGTPSRQGLMHASYVRRLVGVIPELRPRELLRLVPLAGREFVPMAVRRPLTLILSGLAALSASLDDEAHELVARGVPTLFVWSAYDRITTPGVLSAVASDLPAQVLTNRHLWLLTHPDHFAEVLINSLTVQALRERRERGQAVVLPRGMSLADLLPDEPPRRRTFGLHVRRRA